jgi:hypothetical protein
MTPIWLLIFAFALGINGYFAGYRRGRRDAEDRAKYWFSRWEDAEQRANDYRRRAERAGWTERMTGGAANRG